MSMNLREMLNEVLSQSTFLERASFVGSEDVDNRQMVSIANRVAYEIYNFYNWSELRKTFVLTMTETGGIPDTRYDLPDDYQSFIPDSVWETDGSRRVELPVPESRWFLYKFTAFSDGGVMRARLYGDQIEIHDPKPGESFSMEYITKYPILGSDSTPKERFTADTDTFLLDDQMFILGVQGHWGQMKLMPQAMQWYSNYMAKVNEAIGRDAGGQTIGGPVSPSGRRDPYYPLWRPN